MDLSAIRKRCDAASSAPWKWRDDGALMELASAEGYGLCGFDITGGAPPPPVTFDRDFIAHARTDIPALLEEVERLREFCRKAYSELSIEAARAGMGESKKPLIVLDIPGDGG